LLVDKAAISIAASRAVGFQKSKEFAERGAIVIICSVNIASGQKSASLLGGKAYPQRQYVANAQGTSGLMAKRHNGLEVLVNNARDPLDRRVWNKRFDDITEGGLESVIEVALGEAGVFRKTRSHS
jgi:NAD(P)-dependent dehydrogenase (short-subunit alcohol dehydrogenase family)